MADTQRKRLTAEQSRRCILDALAAAGGEITDSKGRVMSKLREALVDLDITSEGVRKHLVALEQAGVIERKVDGRLCFSIRLVITEEPQARVYPAPKVYPPGPRGLFRVVFYDGEGKRRERTAPTQAEADELAARVAAPDPVVAWVVESWLPGRGWDASLHGGFEEAEAGEQWAHRRFGEGPRVWRVRPLLQAS